MSAIFNYEKTPYRLKVAISVHGSVDCRASGADGPMPRLMVVMTAGRISSHPHKRQRAGSPTECKWYSFRDARETLLQLTDYTICCKQCCTRRPSSGKLKLTRAATGAHFRAIRRPRRNQKKPKSSISRLTCISRQTGLTSRNTSKSTKR